MKRILGVLLVASLAGCAATAPQTLRESDLRHNSYFRGDVKFNATFAQVQRSLNLNKEQCGTDFVWRLDSGQVSYATVLYEPTPSVGLSRSVLIDMTYHTNGNIIAKAYSYYADMQPQARAALAALTSPASCPPTASGK